MSNHRNGNTDTCYVESFNLTRSKKIKAKNCKEDTKMVKQVICMLVAVVVLFILCWTPLLIDNVLTAYDVLPRKRMGFYKYMLTIFHLMAYFNRWLIFFLHMHDTKYVFSTTFSIIAFRVSLEITFYPLVREIQCITFLSPLCSMLLIYSFQVLLSVLRLICQISVNPNKFVLFLLQLHKSDSIRLHVEKLPRKLLSSVMLFGRCNKKEKFWSASKQYPTNIQDRISNTKHLYQINSNASITNKK